MNLQERLKILITSTTSVLSRGDIMRRSIFITTIILITLISIAVFPSIFNMVKTYSELKYYALELVYPNPGIPEPVLLGRELELRFRYSNNTIVEVHRAILVNEYSSCSLEFIGSQWNSTWKTLNVYLYVPENCSEGFYTLKLVYSVNGTEKTIEQPNSVWVLKSWPKVVRLLYTADTKTPAGEPYWKTMARLINILNPTLMIFGGDEVETPTSASAWKLFLKYWLELRVPAYAGIGNHEYDAEGRADVWISFFGYRNYTIDLGWLLIVMLDTGKEGWIPIHQIEWLKKVLELNAGKKVKIVYMHHPLFSVKCKHRKLWYIEVKDINETFDYLLRNGYIYRSWTEHVVEARLLFETILKYNVSLVLSGHIHQDLNVVVEYRGRKIYFITVTGVPYDVPEYVPRGFRLIYIYSNGTIDENTLTCCGKSFTDYPTDIPIDSGEGVIPYKLGIIEFYYTPRNDGTSRVVSFKLNNPLDQWFYNVKIVFRVSKDVPISKYRVVPKVNYKVLELPKYYLVVIENVSVPPKSGIWFTITSIDDTEKPIIESLDLDVSAPIVGKVENWLIGRIITSDSGWGVKDVEILLSNDGGKTWFKPALKDLSEDESKNGKIVYYFWIKRSLIAPSMLIKIIVKDFANNTLEKVFKVSELTTKTMTTTTPATSITNTSITTSTPSSVPSSTTSVSPTTARPQISWTLIGIGVLIALLAIAAGVMLRRRR